MSAALTNDQISEMAALYVAGALPPEETADFESRLIEPRVQAELRGFDAVAQALLDAAPAQSPSALLREALFSRVHAYGRPGAVAKTSRSSQATNQRMLDQKSGMTICRGDDCDWEKTDIAGIEVRKLFVDSARNQITCMVRMAPGTSYPRHLHNGVEECYVLQGDLQLNQNLVLRGGDYQRCELGTVHPQQSTEHGCLLLVVSSMTDEVLDH